ncbi:MAG: TetR/AcrR family transcriptional regulator [Alphaproteobacteria bacterium]
MAKASLQAIAADKPRLTGIKPRVDRVARKAKYLRAAASVFLRDGATASMQNVSDEAGAPKPVFYRIFPSRAVLIDAIFQHVHDVILETQKGEWDGYGWALKVLYLEARKDPEIFLVALKTFRGDPAWEPWRDRLLDLLHTQAEAFFRPSEGAPSGGLDRAARAARTLNASGFEILVSWLEDRDGLSDEARFVWYGRIIKEWRWATRAAFALDPPTEPKPTAQS